MSIISKKARYALHGLAYIAEFSDGEPVPFNKILRYLRVYAQRLTLSPGYIAKVFQDVSRAGLTVATPGPRGGYRLARRPEEIRLIEVVEALDGPVGSECCLLSVGECQQQSTCAVRKIILEAELTFYGFFQNETVASMAHKMVFPDSVTLSSYDQQRADRTRS